MKRFMLSAMHSGSGKTVVTCGLLRAFQDRGLSVESFKCGPDYIDPMFHRQVLGLPSRNLDLFLQGPEGVRDTLSRQTAQLALVEGAMGYYDGVNGTDEASAWQVADLADLPVVLVLRPKGISLTLAAQVQGMLHFRTPSHIAGVILTDCKPMLYAHWKPILAQTGVRVLGYLPPMDEAVLESRHLGLILPDEVAGLQHRFAAIARRNDIGPGGVRMGIHGAPANIVSAHSISIFVLYCDNDPVSGILHDALGARANRISYPGSRSRNLGIRIHSYRPCQSLLGSIRAGNSSICF